jgi:hypothetical protein
MPYPSRTIPGVAIGMVLDPALVLALLGLVGLAWALAAAP